MIDRCFKSQMTLLQSHSDWNKVYQAQWLGLWTKSCWPVVCMCLTRLAPVRRAASPYSASPPKRHATGRQLCPNSDHYPDSEPANRSLTPLCWAISRAAERIFFSLLFNETGDRSTNLPHARLTHNHYTSRDITLPWGLFSTLKLGRHKWTPLSRYYFCMLKK